MGIFKNLGWAACATIMTTVAMQAQSFGIGGGLSTPNDAVSSVYNNITLSNLSEDLGDAASLGYHFQAKYRFGLGENLRFSAAIGLHRFPEADIVVTNPKDNKQYTLTATSNLVPISVGLEGVLIKSGIGLYLLGDLSYNYFSNSIGLKQSSGVDVPFVVDSDPFARVGVGVGAGVDFDLGLFVADVTGKYNIANLINKKDQSEPDRSYFALTLSVIFGKR